MNDGAIGSSWNHAARMNPAVLYGLLTFSACVRTMAVRGHEHDQRYHVRI